VVGGPPLFFGSLDYTFTHSHTFVCSNPLQAPCRGPRQMWGRCPLVAGNRVTKGDRQTALAALFRIQGLQPTLRRQQLSRDTVSQSVSRGARASVQRSRWPDGVCSTVCAGGRDLQTRSERQPRAAQKSADESSLCPSLQLAVPAVASWKPRACFWAVRWVILSTPAHTHGCRTPFQEFAYFAVCVCVLFGDLEVLYTHAHARQRTELENRKGSERPALTCRFTRDDCRNKEEPRLALVSRVRVLACLFAVRGALPCEG
jgi:hypothetical protein